jgi:purine-nucleoside phosphorylase
MVSQVAVDQIQSSWKKAGIQTPAAHIVLGSGYGEAVANLPKGWELRGSMKFGELDGLCPATVVDHKGEYLWISKGDTAVSLQLGRLHGYEGHTPEEVTRTVMIPRLAGVKTFILTNAAGGLTKRFLPGHAMIIKDHFNFTGSNPLLGPNPKGPDGKLIGTRFPDMSKLYNEELRDLVMRNVQAQGINVHEGNYLGVLGPSFETPIEVAVFGQLGLHAVGMSTVWEAIALGHSGATLAGISLISNLGTGLSEQALDHDTILKTCRVSAQAIVTGILSSF